MRNFIIKNWKTTTSGVVIIALLAIYLLNKINTEQFLTATTFLIGVGFITSKDGDKTGIK